MTPDEVIGWGFVRLDASKVETQKITILVRNFWCFFMIDG